MSGPPSTSSSPNSLSQWQPLTESQLLSQHSNDPSAALTFLIAQHNQLVRQHGLLQKEKDLAEKAAERSAIENQQLWRSFKSIGVAGSSPRPSGSRQNSESGPNPRLFGSLGGGGASGAVTAPLRRGLSNDTTPPGGILGGGKLLDSSPGGSPASGRLPLALRNDASTSTSSPRSKAITPPPLSPRSSGTLTRTNSHVSLRKAASLDLGRPSNSNSLSYNGLGLVATTSGGIEINEQPPLSPDADTPFSRLMQDPRSLGTTPTRIPISASMPSMVTLQQEEPTQSSYLSSSQPRRYLPSLVPVSPLQIMHQTPVSGYESASSSPREKSSPVFPPSPAQSDLPQPPQLRPPHAISNAAIQRTRSPSNNSNSSQSSEPDERISINTGVVKAASPLQDEYSTPTAELGPPFPFPSYSLQPSTSNNTADPQYHQQHQHQAQQRSVPEQGISPFTVPSSSSNQNPHSDYPFSSSSRPQPILDQSPLPAPPPVRPTLSPAFLPFTKVKVGSSNIKTNEKGKEVISFIIEVIVTVPPESDPERQGGMASWKIEKMYSDVLVLDATVKNKASRQESKSIAALPDKTLFKDNAPHKSDQRKVVLEKYLQTLLSIQLKDKSVVCNFFNTDLAKDQSGPAPSPGTMEGWLTKRGRNFGGWQTRYYVLANDTLSYYDTREGSKLGEISLQHAAIGRQSSRASETGDDSYLHAFLIRTTTRKDDKEQDADHILCAESDEARDAWVMALTSLQSNKPGPSGGRPNGASISFEREHRSPDESRRQQNSSRRRSGSMSGLQQDAEGRFHSRRTPSSDLPPSTSLPASLDLMARSEVGKRANSEMGQYADLQRNKLQAPPGRRGDSDRNGKISERPATPDRRPSDAAPSNKLVASQVSGPMNAAPLPSGYDFKKADRSKKTKSSFWNFASRGGPNDKAGPVSLLPHAPPRPVFGVPLKEAVAISRIRPGLELPAVVYRCVEYLEAKNAESEEGIFRLSGSANVIRLLKDRFNAEGDVQLLNSAEYYDPHAVAGLLKSFLRELPVHLLTRELHAEFIQVIDLRNRKDRVNALGKLVARLPIEEYTLFRFFFAHLCVIAQNAEVSKMNLRNLGIVFSPTLNIPAPLFTLLLAEFDLVFAVEKETGLSKPIMVEEDEGLAEPRYPNGNQLDFARRPARPNSELYERSGANVLMEGEARGAKLQEPMEEESELESDAYEEAPEDAESTVGLYSAPPSFPNPNSHEQFLSLPAIPTHSSSSPATSPRTSSFSNPYQQYPTHLNSPQPGYTRGLPASPRPGATFQQALSSQEPSV